MHINAYGYDRTCQVTITVPQDSNAQKAYLLGDFQKDQRVLPLRRAKDGTFQLTLEMEVGREYRLQLVVQ